MRSQWNNRRLIGIADKRPGTGTDNNAIMAFGIYITYKILDFPDLTVDGSFPMGAAIAAALISRDVNPLLTLPICFLLGAVVGTLTGLIHVKLKVRDLLSGIIMMTALIR